MRPGGVKEGRRLRGRGDHGRGPEDADADDQADDDHRRVERGQFCLDGHSGLLCVSAILSETRRKASLTAPPAGPMVMVYSCGRGDAVVHGLGKPDA